MNIEDSLDYLFRIQKDLEDWEDKYNLNKDHSWFTSYVFMTGKIRALVKDHLKPIHDFLTETNQKLGQFFEKKDLPYHIETAQRYTSEMKEVLKGLVQIYEKGEPYDKLRVEWGIALRQLSRLTRDLRGRLLIIKRIVNQTN